MNYAISNRPNFLVEDPAWAEDFAPNGTLLGLGDTITRKRYAKLVSPRMCLLSANPITTARLRRLRNKALESSTKERWVS
jgi:hypothetical protein